ncbi:MAG: DUF2914 domain-containing protein, partial [Armatimonadota bacterium]|nr:DUF2914 domain-containing protein [Armatimonadota bacterium]
VVRDVLAARVENRQPVEATVPVAADIGELFYFTEVAGGPGTIRHVWIWQGRTMATVSLRVGASPGWKTWSSKSIMPQWTGPWRVEARDGDTVLSFKEFEVKR